MQSPWNEPGVGQHVVDLESGNFLGMPLPHQFLSGADPAETGQCVGNPWRPVEGMAQIVRQERFLGFVLQHGGMGIVGDAQRQQDGLQQAEQFQPPGEKIGRKILYQWCYWWQSNTAGVPQEQQPEYLGHTAWGNTNSEALNSLLQE